MAPDMLKVYDLWRRERRGASGEPRPAHLVGAAGGLRVLIFDRHDAREEGRTRLVNNSGESRRHHWLDADVRPVAAAGRRRSAAGPRPVGPDPNAASRGSTKRRRARDDRNRPHPLPPPLIGATVSSYWGWYSGRRLDREHNSPRAWQGSTGIPCRGRVPDVPLKQASGPDASAA
jgi:hypothetical protein